VIGALQLIENEYGAVRLEAAPHGYPIEPMHDSYGRRINYMRISLTDACNLRCVYCMPEQMQFRPRRELMSDAEIPVCRRGMLLLRPFVPYSIVKFLGLPKLPEVMVRSKCLMPCFRGVCRLKRQDVNFSITGLHPRC
jgi:hypothetical protein